MTSTYAIDGFGGIETVDHEYPGGRFQRSYDYDRAGRIVGVDEGATRLDYDFDDRGRLTEVRTDRAITYEYGYDANDNRTSWRTPTSTCAADCVEVDDQDRLRRYGRGADEVRFTYDARGRVETRTSTSGTRRFVYDNVGLLDEVTLESGTRVRYLHAPDGSRVVREVDGVRQESYVWLGGVMAAKLDRRGELLVRYLYLDSAWTPSHAVHRDGRLFRIITDQVGSVREVVHAETGVVVQRYAYSPFGVFEDESTVEDIVPHRFAGGLYDNATGLYRFGARDYDPQIGRWLAKDPISFAGGDTNLYGYVGQDPINFADPSGRSAIFVWNGAAIAAGAAGGAAAHVISYVANTNRNEFSVNDMVGAAVWGAVKGGTVAATRNPFAAALVGGLFGAVAAAANASRCGARSSVGADVFNGFVGGAFAGFVGRSLGEVASIRGFEGAPLNVIRASAGFGAPTLSRLVRRSDPAHWTPWR